MTEAPIDRVPKGTRLSPQFETTQQAQSDEEAAAAIGAAVASGATVAVVAPAVLAVLPRPVLVLEGGQVAALIASSVATFAVEEPPELGTMADADSVAEFYEELVFRGLYALSAARRLIAAMSEGTTLSERRALIRDALTVERRFFEQHLEAQRRRSRARQSGRDAVARWGQDVSWVHGHPKEPRPTHLAADGRNFRPALGPPVLTGVLPGVLPGCTCTYGPPKAGAAVMASARGGASDSPTLSETDRMDLGLVLGQWPETNGYVELDYDPLQPRWPEGTPVVGGRWRKLSDLVKFLLDEDRDPTPDEVREILDGIARAKFSAQKVRVPEEHRETRYLGRKLGAEVGSQRWHAFQASHVNRQWAEDTTPKQYLEDLQAAARQPGASVAIYKRRGGSIASAIASPVSKIVPKSRRGPNAERMMFVVFSVDRDGIITGYQTGGRNRLSIPKGTKWHRRP